MVVVEIVVVVVIVALVATVVVDGDGDRGCGCDRDLLSGCECVDVEECGRRCRCEWGREYHLSGMDGLWCMRRLPGVVGGKWASVDGGGRCTCVHTILMCRPLLKEYSLISCTPAHTHHTLLSMCA